MVTALAEMGKADIAIHNEALYLLLPLKVDQAKGIAITIREWG